MVFLPSISSGILNSIEYSNPPLTALLARANDQRYDDYYDDEYQETQTYEEDYRPNAPKRTYMPSQLTNFLELFRNHKQLGASLVGLGLMLTVAGMMFFFNGTLLRVGNICIILGVPLLVGPDSVKEYFLRKDRTQATLITGIGILLVMWGKPRFGILFEIFGLLNTVGNMNPLVLALIKKMPLVGDMISAFDGSKSRQREENAGRGRPRPRPQKQRYSQF